ncbi:MAG: DNA polymerase III subunit delta [Candidatus Omnitrophica bacterium]|nr:DNA polymerase III subunit delta [Candidatus Omnitrophota bacterium]
MVIPSYFVLVGDSFLCEEKRKEIITAFEKEINSRIPVSLKRAGETPLETILSEARTLPFLTQAQAFCLRDADQFKKGEIELLANYFESPPPQTLFIFEAESLEKNHPLLTQIGKKRQVFFLRGGGERITSDFIQRKLKQAKKKITPEALGRLISQVGDSFIFLDTLLEQLILYSGDKQEIDRSCIEAFEERLEEFEGGDFVQALSDKNLPRALEILNDLLEINARDFPAVVGLLHWQLRRFWEAKKESKQLGRFSLKELEEILEGLFELDWKLKSGRAEGRYEVETWLINATGRAS